eukprot:CAMPEP_0171095636 /NCGR_PEP_ID=MMETSP0766_2-20121228/43282_1 /TAXON_ID=439317 /ORGANISM="Gambierdiscus australes, Strain CAWD 149" /LENGTH=288 /DNA_ID=CAMNT_0011554467 /DNA_START=63 /DNA_END=929 /DNA_ORIENTATION=+
MVACDELVAKPSSRQDGSCAVGGLEAPSLQRLARFVGEQDEAELKRKLRDELHIENDAFASAFLRSSAVCRRGALLYPSSNELAISFNGGKDACVVLYLWLAALAATAPSEPAQVIYFDSPDEFVSVRCFVAWVASCLHLQMVTFTNRSFKLGMEELVAQNVRAVVMGQRRGDPWTSGLSAFSPSTDGWPAFMRINPILEWSYADVWTFLRAFGLPYCELYDQGYTSLGGINNTLQNPALLRPDGSYGPAHELQDESLERAGRTATVKTGAKTSGLSMATLPASSHPA